MYTRRFAEPATQALTPRIVDAFLRCHAAPDVRKTHLFGGRYENIYLDERHIPELALLIDNATRLAGEILGLDGLRAGYWFNFMPPGAVTLPHTHDDDDEMLSGVYYLEAPANSGELILHHDKILRQPGIATRPANSGELILHHDTGQETITPEAGLFVFFSPRVRHEVSENRSTKNRLSIGMNFGIPAATG